MKKLLVFTLAAAAVMASCSKVEDNSPLKEISFQVANRLQTKASGAVYANGAFGTYAWFNGTDPFMVNERIDLVGGVWKAADHTFYWPRTGSIDFVSYSPFDGTSNTDSTVPAITKDASGYHIDYTGYTVGTTDLMYADKATCSSNVDQITDTATPESGYTGVPTLFRHALAKVGFRVCANFLEYGTGTDKTTWEVTLNSASISGLLTTGDCSLSWNGSEWVKPAGNLWTNASGASAAQELVPSSSATGVTLKAWDATDPEGSTTALDSVAGYVLPQALAAGTQILTMQIHIKTTLPNGLVIEEDYTPTCNLSDISSLSAWEMNQNIIYTFKIKPVAYVSSYDNPEDVVITFDPAVSDWVEVDATATIQI